MGERPAGRPASPPRTVPLEQRLGHIFERRDLLTRALTHRSFGADHNERLEFLGDAVLSLAVSRLLFDRFSGSDEGDLTRVRAHLVREESLHQIALALDLPGELRLSEGEARGGGAARPSILADALEALIGAVCVDAGFEAAQQVVTRLFEDQLSGASTDRWRKDPKTELQEWLQARHVPVPGYRIVATHGQAHAQTFDVACEVPSLAWSASGTGRSRRLAEQAAAQQLLDRIRAGELDAPTRKGPPGA
jgi:ribonuclease-3